MTRVALVASHSVPCQEKEVLNGIDHAGVLAVVEVIDGKPLDTIWECDRKTSASGQSLIVLLYFAFNDRGEEATSVCQHTYRLRRQERLDEARPSDGLGVGSQGHHKGWTLGLRDLAAPVTQFLAESWVEVAGAIV